MILTEWRKQSPRPVAIIWLDRPEKKNALTPGMLEDLCAALTQAGSQATVVVLAGKGDALCAGFDLTLCRENSEALKHLLSGLSRAIRLMRDLPCPVVVAAHGAAIAGGCALLGGADIVVTHESCRFGYPVVRLGISPAVSTPFLAASIGHGRARERQLGGQSFTGEQAMQWGLAHAMAATPEQVIEEACIIADQLACKPSSGLTATKQWLNEVSPCTEARAALEVSLSLVGSDEERTRLAALWG
jgi:enoyl-CoA hydratase/carnithine racemase